MKCSVCNGKGYTYVRTAPNSITGYGYKRICDKCHGTGEIKQTEQEYIQTCNTEQLAEFIVNLTLLDKYKLYDRMESAEYDIGIGVGAKKVIVEWLKQPHTQ